MFISGFVKIGHLFQEFDWAHTLYSRSMANSQAVFYFLFIYLPGVRE